MATGPRPGTLEWLADARPDEPVLLTPDGGVTRAAWEARADALAEHLVRDRGVAAGDLLTAAGRIGPDWLTLSWAAAKLGAGLAGLPPGPGRGLPDAVHVDASTVAPPDAGAPRRLSGAAAPPDAVTFSRSGRAVRRTFTPEAVGAIGPALADLVARVRAAPGTTLTLAGPVSDGLLTFMASVVLVGGGRVAVAPEPAEALALGAVHDAGLAALAPADLVALAVSPARGDLDVTALAAVVTGGAPLTPAARAIVDDLFGDETLIDVYATADAGVIAVRGAGEAHHLPLDGVEVRTDAGGLLEVRSPLAAAPGWIRTGDRAALHAGGRLELR